MAGRRPTGHPGWGQLELIQGQGGYASLLQEALALAEEDAREAGTVGFAARLFVQLALPYRDPGEVAQWVRRNGTMELFVQPGIVVDHQTGKARQAYPYGVMPRLLTTWLATEAVKTRDRTLVLGRSLRSFLDQLGLASTGGTEGTIRRLREQMTRLFMARMVVVGWTDQFEGAQAVGIADRYDLWWSNVRPIDQPFWDSTVTLSESFFKSILAAPVPVDLRALRALRVRSGSPMRLDIYTWLTYRLKYLRRQTTVPWEALALQFGGDYKQLRQFKAQFLKQLAAVRLVYPLADVQSLPAGLVLRPSPTHVAPRRITSELNPGADR